MSEVMRLVREDDLRVFAEMQTEITRLRADLAVSVPRQEGMVSDPRYMRPGINFVVGKAVEELGELQAALGKTLRWGWRSYNPDLPPNDRETNTSWVCREIKDVRDALDNLEREMADNLGAKWPPIRQLRADLAEARGILERWLIQADHGNWRDKTGLSLGAAPLSDVTRSFLDRRE